MNKISERKGHKKSKEKVVGAVSFALEPCVVTAAIAQNNQRHDDQTEIDHDDVQPKYGVENIQTIAKSQMQLVW